MPARPSTWQHLRTERVERQSSENDVCVSERTFVHERRTPGRDGVRLFGVPTVRASPKTLDVSASGQVVNLLLRVDKAGVDQQHASPMPRLADRYRSMGYCQQRTSNRRVLRWIVDGASHCAEKRNKTSKYLGLRPSPHALSMSGMSNHTTSQARPVIQPHDEAGRNRLSAARSRFCCAATKPAAGSA